RLVAFEGQHVTFCYSNHRELDDRGKPRQQELTLTVTEFLRRWSEHVPLPGVHMVRAWGLYAATQRGRLEPSCEQLSLSAAEREPPARPMKSDRDHPTHDHPWEQCPVCRQPMVVRQVLPRAGAPPAQRPWAEAA